MVKLGQLLEQAENGDEAESWYRRAADAGGINAMVRLGQLSEQAQNRRRAESWYRRAADAGGIDGAIKLGQLCGGMPEGTKRYERTVGSENSDGMIKLGQLLEQVQDWDEAESWYRRAADAGTSMP
jgi:TPR repeat protein